MEKKLKFGTDGWRSVIADEFTYANIDRVTQATCDVVRKKSKSRLILIGYDPRFLSDRFAKRAASVALGNRFKVEISNEPMTSPALSYQVKVRKAAIGIMLTASHNPAHFGGFKLKGAHGGSVDESLTSQIEEALDENEIQHSQVEPKSADFISGYCKWIKKFVPSISLTKLKGPVVFDAMHGAGGRVFEKIIGEKKELINLRKELDPLFGGGNPEPIESNLSLLKETVLRKKAALGIAVDGDADRVGVVDNRGRFVPPHTVMPLLIRHLIENRKLKGKIIQTVSMGYLPGRLAERHKLGFDEVPVGFKYVAAKMRESKVLFGGEESGGFGVGLWSNERDGLLCALLLIEYLIKTKKPLDQSIEDLYKEYGVSNFKRVDFQIKSPIEKGPWTTKIESKLTKKIGEYPIKSLNNLDGIKVILEDESWVLMRPSGTEPLVRTYSEGTSSKIVKDLLLEAEKLVLSGPVPRNRPKKKTGSVRR